MRETVFLAKKIIIFGKEFTVHLDTIGFTIFACLFIFILCIWLKRKLQFIPTRKQLVLEVLLEWFDDVLRESLGKRGRLFLGFIVTLFLFILVSNWLGLIPGFLSPTRDLNVCLGLALLVLVVAHINAIKVKGLKQYLKSYFEPYWWLFASNVFAEISKTLSHSFRLFGNIFAGGIAVAVIFQLCALLKAWGILPAVLIGFPIKAFLGFFMAGIQAFVFTILAVSYISVLAQQYS
ncbi:MAG: F0F1 ATP synthase subunit A [Candidatus Omnitrophota bacterium]|nr:MAG: F0F1 ATP synthase subunit A [Candidatus Omnitrophota bacterium]